MMEQKPKNSLKHIGVFLLCVLLCHAAGIIGSVFTIKAIPVWYALLEKPWFNPPNWIFGPVWLTLYTMMGISLYLIWRHREKGIQVTAALTIFGVQLFLNAIWTPVFFGAKLLAPAFAIIVLLWISIIATIGSFKNHSKTAALLLVPYLLWVTFAAILNFSLWILNRG